MLFRPELNQEAAPKGAGASKQQRAANVSATAENAKVPTAGLAELFERSQFGWR
jgi:hypothetical protein